MRTAALPSIAALALLGAGCVSPATTLQTARPVEPGGAELTFGASVPLHVAYGTGFVEIARQAARQAEMPRELSEDERRQLLRGAMAVVLFQPSAVYQFELRAGVIDRLDLGIRTAGPAFKADLKYQLVRSEAYDLALTVGYVHHSGLGASFAEAAYSVFESMRLVSYGRQDIDSALIISGDPEQIFSGYGAARYVAGFASVETELDDELLPPGAAARTDQSGTLHTFGATAGLRLGSPRFAVLAELGLMWVVFDPTILGEPVDLGGMLITPALAFDARF